MIEMLAALAGALALFAFVLWWSFRGTRRAWAFLARYHHDGGIGGYLKVLPKLLEAMRHARSPVTIFEAALILTEIDILIPAEERPSEYDSFDKEKKDRESIRKSFKIRLTAWKADERKRRRDNARSVDKLVKWVAYANSQIGVPDEIKITLPSLPESDRPIISIDNPAAIDNSRDLIKRYFIVARSVDDKHRAFHAFVKMNDGFLAPIFLISGLMSRFDEDWKPIINNYRRQLEDATSRSSRELVELQSFEFNCWLLWGPSVPLCRCDQWRPEAGKNDPDRAGIFYQYGFGDENNSVNVFVKKGQLKDFTDKVESWLKQPNALGSAQGGGASDIIAATPRSIIGKIMYGPATEEKHVCKAQRVILTDASRIILHLDEQQIIEGPSGSQYYSAYIWIMFVVCDAQGDPIYREEKDRWKNLLPFFEHGNIADANTMQTLKENLVAKSINALREILLHPGDRKRNITIRYACAFDDSNCTERDGVLFKHGDITIFDPNTVSAKRPTRILNLLQHMACADMRLHDEMAAKRLLVPGVTIPGMRPSAAPWPHQNAFSACRLPEVIDGFFKAINEKEESANETDRVTQERKTPVRPSRLAVPQGRPSAASTANPV